MSLAITTIIIGDACEKLSEITLPRMRAYAEKCGADLIVRRETEYAIPHFEKYELIRTCAQRGYSRMLYLDCDVYVRAHAQNIFEKYSSAAFNECPHPTPGRLDESIAFIRNRFDPTWPDSLYLNTGVLLLDDLGAIAQALNGVIPVPGVFFEQEQLNVILRQVSKPATHMDARWNQITGPAWYDTARLAKAFFLHGCGTNEDKYDAMKKIVETYP